MFKDGNLDRFEVFDNFKHEFRAEIITFIQLAFNKESPLVGAYQDIISRREVAALQAGLDPEKEWVRELIEFKNEEVNDLVHCYLSRVQTNNTWQMLITDQMIFWEYQQSCMEPLNMADKDKAMKTRALKTKMAADCVAIAARISGYFQEIFADNADAKEAAEKKVRITPEMMASGKR